MSYSEPRDEKSHPRVPAAASEPDNVFDVEATKEIFTQLKKINNALPGAHQSLLSIVEHSGEHQPKPRTYVIYREIMNMVESGVTVYSTSKRLGIPYSTCHAYTKMSPEQVAKLKKAATPDDLALVAAKEGKRAQAAGPALADLGQAKPKGAKAAKPARKAK